MNLDDTKRKKLCKAFIKECIGEGEFVSSNLPNAQALEHQYYLKSLAPNGDPFTLTTIFSLKSVDQTKMWVASRFAGQDEGDDLIRRAWQGNMLALRLTEIEAQRLPDFSYEHTRILGMESVMVCLGAYAGGDEVHAGEMAGLLLKHVTQGGFSNNAYSEPDMLAFIAWLLTGISTRSWPDWHHFAQQPSHFTALIDAIRDAAKFPEVLFQMCDLRLARRKGYFLPTDAKKKQAFMYYYEGMTACAWLTDLMAFKKLAESVHGITLNLDIPHPVMQQYICYVPDMTQPLQVELIERSISQLRELGIQVQAS